MSLNLISQSYVYDSDGDKPGSDIKDNENELGVSNGTGFGIIENTKKLETNNGKKFKLVPNPSILKKKKVNPKQDNENILLPKPKTRNSKGQTKSSKTKKTDLIHKSGNDENDAKTTPDLNMQLPFTHCKIVFRLEPDEDGDIDDTQIPIMGWERQGKEFIFHDVITHQEMKRLERYARKREQSSRPCPKSKRECSSGREGVLTTRSSITVSSKANEPAFSQKRDSTNNTKMPREHSIPDAVNVEDMVTNANDAICVGDNDGDSDDDKPVSSYPIVAESGKIDDAKFTGSQTSLPLIFRCPFCLQGFNVAGALVKHLPLHTGKNLKSDDQVASSSTSDSLSLSPLALAATNKAENVLGKLHNRSSSRLGNKIPSGTRCDKLLKQLGLGLGCKKQNPDVTNYGFKTSAETVEGASINEDKKAIGISGNVEMIQPTHDRPGNLRRSEKSYQCPQCTKSFTMKYNFQCHVLIHEGIKPHKCSVCQKTFSRRRYLTKHSIVHSGIRPFKCTICPNTFSQWSNWNRHLLTHSGLRPHKCNLCPKTFPLLGDLNRHLLTHSGIKPHKCNLCPKSYYRRGDLNRHLLTHSELKPHKCNLCPTAFSRRDHLNRHLLAHTAE